MSSTTVTVLTIHGRRQNIQVHPHTTLLQILEEVCKKYDFNSEEYCLKHHNKELDLSQMFRFSGLPHKCLLEMQECSKKRKEDSEVVICIQLEDNTRFQGQFFPNQTLKEVLQQLYPACVSESKFNNNLVLIYMRAELYGDALEKTTLKSLGITKGRAMFRILNKNPEDLKNQASVYVPLQKSTLSSDTIRESEIKSKEKKVANNSSKCSDKKDIGTTSDKIRNIAKNDELNKANDEAASAEPLAPEKPEYEAVSSESAALKKIEYDWGTSVGRSMNEKLGQSPSTNKDEQSDEEMIEEPEIFEIGERNAVLFSLNSAQKVADEIPDSFFDLTIDDIKVILRDLHKVQSGNEDAPLLTAKLRELEENNRTLTKLNQYKRSVIRIQFPDRMVLQGTFSPVDKIENVYEFVKNYLKDTNLNFFLFTTPPKHILSKDLTLVEANCVPTAVLHFGIDEMQQESYLKDDLKHTTATGAMLAASKSRGLFSNRNQQQQQQKSEQSEPGPSFVRTTPLASTGAIPKQPKPESSFQKSSSPSGVSNPVDSAEKIPKWFKKFQK